MSEQQNLAERSTQSAFINQLCLSAHLDEEERAVFMMRPFACMGLSGKVLSQDSEDECAARLRMDKSKVRNLVGLVRNKLTEELLPRLEVMSLSDELLSVINKPGLDAYVQRQLKRHKGDVQVESQALSFKITSSELPNALMRVLMDNHFRDMREFEYFTFEQLAQIQGVGAMGYDAIESEMKKYGLAPEAKVGNLRSMLGDKYSGGNIIKTGILRIREQLRGV